MEEKNKKNFLKWLEEKKIRQVLFFVVSMAVLIGVYTTITGHIKQRLEIM